MEKKKGLYLFANRLIRLLAACVIFVLFLHSIFSTSFIGWTESYGGGMQKRTLNIADSPLKHLIAYALFLLVSWGIYRGYARLREKGRFGAVCPEKGVKILCFMAFLLGMVWIMVTQLAPGNDPAKIYAIAMQWRTGNFSSFAEGGYLFRYPFQSGIVLFYYLLSFVTGVDNYVGLQLVNAVALAFIYYFLAKLSGMFWKSDKRFPVLACLSTILWIPMLYYTTYLYGVLPGMAFALAAVYQMLRYLESKKLRNGIGMAVCIGIAIVLKSNCLIYLVAMLCFLLYDILETLLYHRKEAGKKWLISALCIVLCLGSYLGFTAAYEKATEKISGYELTEGAAMVSWVVMGLQDSENATGPGEYNGYIIDIFQKYHYDSRLIKDASVTDIRKILKRMSENPLDDGVTFFAQKMAFQWNDPTFAAIERSQERESAVKMPALAAGMIDGQESVWISVALNGIQTLVWIGVLLYLYLHRKSENLYELTGIVIFLGGYLFHFAWESGASYTLPYFLILIPYAVKGQLDLVRGIECKRKAWKAGTLQENRRQFISVATGVVLAVVFVLLLRTTNLFYETIALDDGSYAREQFYHREKTATLENGNYVVSPMEDAESCLAHQGEMVCVKDGQLSDVHMEGTDEGWIFRYPDNEQVLGARGERLTVYMDDELNMYYQQDPDVRFVWTLKKAEDGQSVENVWFILVDDYALTWRSGKVALEAYSGDRSQMWQIR